MTTPAAREWKLTKIRLTVATLGCFGFGLLVLGRAAIVQIKGDERLADLARKQFQSKVLVRPRRGLILDRNGEPFAVNLETRSLAANPQKLKGKHHVLGLISKVLSIPPSKLRAKLAEGREFVWIRRHIPEDVFAQFGRMGLMNPGTGELVEGLWLVKESQRVYPHGELAAQVLGSVNIDAEGLEGTEVWQNEKLRGKIASVNAIRDALGRPTFIDTDAAKNLKDGEPITLTLDASLQYSVEQELKESLAKTRAHSGSVIVMNAENGEILALASLPTFNPNSRGGPVANRRNRPLTDGYEPGSVIKPILMASALMHGWKPTDTVYGNQGNLIVQGRKISEAEAHEKFEWISLKKTITVSSNVASAKIALRLGGEKFTSTLKTMGLGTKTPIGFPGELGGWIPSSKGMQPLTLATMAFGQGLFVTPIQVARAYATFLNGGLFIQPKLLKEPPTLEKIAQKRVLPRYVADRVVDALISVVEEKEGTGKEAALPGYRVGGKTGTSQVVDPRTRRYSATRYIASFAGFAVGVDPKLVIYTQLDGPQGVYYASATAAPLFQKVLAVVANRFGLPANPKMLLAAHPVAHPSGASSSLPVLDQLSMTQAAVSPELAPAVPTPEIKPAPGPAVWEGANEGKILGWKMPTLKGFSAREVLQSLEGKDVKLKMLGFGNVKEQYPSPGAFVRPGERISLRLGE